MKAIVENHEILKILEHKYPFLMVDKIIDFCFDNDARSITTVKNASAGEPHFQGHFPSFPVMPGVLIIEAMGQSALLCGMITGIQPLEFTKKRVLLTSIDNAKFRKPVLPGDSVIIKCSFAGEAKRGIQKCDCSAFVDDKLVAKADLSAHFSDSPED